MAGLTSATWGEHETVTKPRLGEKVLGVMGVALDFPSQLVDKNPKVLDFIAVFRAPHCLK